MNQRKAKAIRREIRKIHGHSKSLKTEIFWLPTIRIFTEGKFRRAFKHAMGEELNKLRGMNVIIPIEVLYKRVANELPDVGLVYRDKNEHMEARADEARQAFKAEKKVYTSLKKKARARRYA